MDNLTMVFLGTHFFTFDLPFTEEFETVCELSRLDRLRSEDDPEFEYAQALCVETGSGFVSREEVQWFLCFPVERKRKGYYVPRTESVPPSGKNVFYSFYSYRFEVPLNSPVRVVPDLDSLNLLSPRRGDKLPWSARRTSSKPKSFTSRRCSCRNTRFQLVNPRAVPSLGRRPLKEKGE